MSVTLCQHQPDVVRLLLYFFLQKRLPDNFCYRHSTMLFTAATHTNKEHSCYIISCPSDCWNTVLVCAQGTLVQRSVMHFRPCIQLQSKGRSLQAASANGSALHSPSCKPPAPVMSPSYKTMHRLSLSGPGSCGKLQQERKRKGYTFLRQFNGKPSILPGCPGKEALVITHHADRLRAAAVAHTMPRP